MANSVAIVSRYFRIRGGDTIVELKGDAWTRWDRWDGPVGTSIWTAESPELNEIDATEAAEVIRSISR